ncbi:MAG: hypothetical protein COB30_005945 [Ectothiorhodospiraceae bacterium]|nr:hypothetical protein [Ectothiorhodospiraceae bacterium]
MWKKILKFLMWLFIIALISGIVIGATILMGRPIIEGAYALGAIFGIWFLVIVIRKLIIRMRAKAQVNRILNQGTADEQSDLGMNDTQLLKELKGGWSKALTTLKKSQLKLKGNPLYVLPWYMVIGKPRSGKSTALKNAKLLLPEIDLPKQTEGSTLNLAWWLYEEAIVIDTAGRYAVPDDETRDRKEWGTLLGMLARHKQKEPINGLVVVVTADRLLNDNEDTLMEEGRQVRASINELMEKLEVHVPIYLMITKCDLIEGFSDWCEYVPEKSLLQPMGFLKEEQGGDIHDIVNQGLDSVLDRMKDLRLLMLERSQNIDDCLLTLPRNMDKLREGLHAFINAALKENPYQDTPKFRGLYFTSSQQNITERDGSSKARDHGMFLQQLFTRVMPADRGLLDTLPSAARLRRAALQYGLSIGGGLTVLAFITLTILFTGDHARLKEIKSVYSTIDLQQRNINEQVYALSNLRELILELSAEEDAWTIPWLGGFSRSEQLEKLITAYNENFNLQILGALDKSLKKTINTLKPEVTSDLAGGLIRRINLIKTRIKDEPEVSLDDKPTISYEYLLVANDTFDRDTAQLFNDLYITYLRQTQGTAALEAESGALQDALLQLIKRTHGDYSWIIAWANSQGFDPVTIKQFWSGSRDLDNPPLVESAYTLQGRDFLMDFLVELEAANDGASRLADIKKEFEVYYERRYITAWQEFAENFDLGKNKLRDKKEWMFSLERMATRENPYFALMKRINTELKPFPNASQQFEALGMIGYFNEMLAYTKKEGGGSNSALTKMALKLVGKAGKVGKLVAKVGKKGMKAKKKLGGKGGAQMANVIEDAAKALDEYKKSLLNVAFSADTGSQSYAATSALFSNKRDPGAGDGAAAAAWKAIIQLQRLVGRPLPSNKVFWSLYTGPLTIAHEFMREEASCFLQDKWQNNVLAGIEGVTKNKLSNTLIGEEGLVWSYVEGDGAPFLNKPPKKGYLANDLNGKRIRWTPNFLDFINKAAAGRYIVGSKFSVKMNALPTGVNQNASISPYATFLTLHCADGVQELANYNYPGSTEFNWSLETCGATTLQIEIGHVTLRKQYKGPKGFSRFLNDFKDGRRIFVSSEFPDQEKQLENEGVLAVDVNYEIFGQEPIIQMLENAPMNAPQRATYCW